jgi:hypothetical protein
MRYKPHQISGVEEVRPFYTVLHSKIQVVADRGRRRPNPNKAPVTAPIMSTLPRQVKAISTKCSPEKIRERYIETCKHRAKLWKNRAPIFILPQIKLSQLENRAKNNKNDVVRAEKKIEEMKSWPADACSGLWQDADGRPLMAVFADLIIPKVRIFVFTTHLPTKCLVLWGTSPWKERDSGKAI